MFLKLHTVRKILPQILSQRHSLSEHVKLTVYSNRLFSTASACLNLPKLKQNTAPHKEVIQEKIKLAEGLDINYGRIGHGPHVVLCIPGIFGTVETDFEPIMKQFDHNQFTVLSLDLPGYGKSRPPHRQIGRNPYVKDAQVVESLMKTLEIPKYSIVGWSIGAATGMHVIANDPSKIDKFIFWGTPAYVDSYWVALSERMLYPVNWPKERWETMCKVYDQNEMMRMTEDLHNYLRKAEKAGSYRVDLLLPSIRTPTLILHGKMDMACPIEQTQVFHQGITNSKLEVWPDGQHDLHFEFPERFVQRLERFLLTAK